MSSTNHTTNYELSQYVGTDKPTYLGDYNGDMSKIDTAMHNNAQSISGVSSDVTLLSGQIGTLSDLTTTDKSSIVNAVNEVNGIAGQNKTNVGTLTNLETSNKTTIVNAINEIVEKFNFSYKNNLTVTLTNTQGTQPTVDAKINSAYNNDGSIGKIYGYINLTGAGTGLAFDNITIADTGLRPSSDITLLGCALMNVERTGQQYITLELTYTLKTDGTVVLNQIPTWSDESRRLEFIACLIFANDFGDTPVTPQ